MFSSIKKTLLATALLTTAVFGMAHAQDPATDGDSWIVYEADIADFTGHNPDIFLLHVNSGEITQLTQNLVDRQFYRNTDPALSPDGSQIAFVSDRDRPSSDNPLTDIYVMNRDGSDQTRVTFNEVYDSSPAWLDNDHLIYTSGMRPGELVVLDLTDGTETHLGIEGYAPAPNADGTQIAYVFEGGLYIIQADGSGSRLVTDAVEGMSGPVWSPDDSQLLFTSRDKAAYGVYVVDTDGENVQQISAESVFGATWSPDGTQIAYVLLGGVPEGQLHPVINLYVMQADGSDSHLLAGLAGWSAYPDWN
ncbi:MAG: hypothetical protein DPW16_09695 [Chloroflexi bacterium]|nr:hypothetical protein [Chloroflexota bacterium]